MLDTSFLISLVDNSRSSHEAAKKFYQYFIENKIAMILSSIVTSEFCIKQPITDLPLEVFRTLPFNIPDSHHLSNLFMEDFKGQFEGTPKSCVKDDFKIVSQCSFNKIKYFITEDGKLIAQLRKMSHDKKIDFQVLSLNEGVDVSFGIPPQLF